MTNFDFSKLTSFDFRQRENLENALYAIFYKDVPEKGVRQPRDPVLHVSNDPDFVPDR